MTQTQKDNEINLARDCFVVEFDRQLAAGEISKKLHDELVAKAMAS